MNTVSPHYKICTCKKEKREQCTQTVNWSAKRHLPVLSAEFQSTNIQILIDSGSMLPLISEEQYQGLSVAPKVTDETLSAFGCNGSQLSIIGKAEGLFRFVKHDNSFLAQFYILQNASSPCILPSTWLETFKAKLDYNLLSLTYTLPEYQFLINAQGQIIRRGTPEVEIEAEVGETGGEGDQAPGDGDQLGHQEDQLGQQEADQHLRQAGSIITLKPKAVKCYTISSIPIWPPLVITLDMA